MNSAIAFLTTEAKEQTITFANEIAKKLKIDVFIIEDDVNVTEIKIIHNVKLLHISDHRCEMEGYINSTTGTHIQKTPNAIDKFLYMFCESEDYDFVWLFEEDVFIPSVDAFINLHKCNFMYDLVCAKHIVKTDQVIDWNWKSIIGKIEKPWFSSMNCVTGFSRKLFNLIKEYVDKHKTLFNSEVMFNTLAHQNNLKISTPLELRTIMWKADWSIDDVLTLKNNLFHPVKSIDRQEALRTMMDLAKDIEYESVNKLPLFLKTENNENEKIHL